MPLNCLINPTILTQPIVAGSVDVVYGSQNHSTAYEGLFDYFYEYNYAGLFIDASLITGIPNGAKIYQISMEVENTTNGTYPENNVYTWMAQIPTSFTEFPLNTRINLTSSTDTTWNGALINATQVSTNTNTTYIQTSGDPNINWLPTLPFDTDFTYQSGNHLLISINSRSGTYTSGSSSNPKHRGINLSGTQPRLFFRDNKISGPAYTDTQVTNMDLTFKPNIRIYYR